MICSTCQSNRWRLSTSTIDTTDGPAFERTCSVCGAAGPYVLADPTRTPKHVDYGAVENAALEQNIVYPDLPAKQVQRMRRNEPVGIDCLSCGGKTKVIDSRFRGDGSIRRRRGCLNCGHRHTTYELSNDGWDAITRRQKVIVAEMRRHADAIAVLAQEFDGLTDLSHLDTGFTTPPTPDLPALSAPTEDAEEATWHAA